MLGLRHLNALGNLEDLNVSYIARFNDSTLLGWTGLTNLRSLSLDSCCNINNRRVHSSF